MKGADIKIGEEYGVYEYGTSESYNVAKRARVIATQRRQKYSFSERSTQYWTVVWLDDDGNDTRRTSTVTARKIVRPWPEQAALNEKHEQQQREAAAARDASWVAYAAVYTRIEQLAPGLVAQQERIGDRDSAPTKAIVNLRKLAEIIDRLETHDKAVLGTLAERTKR